MGAEARPWTTPTGAAKTGMWDGTRQAGEQFTEQQKQTMLRLKGRTDGWDILLVKISTPRERTVDEARWGKPLELCVIESQVACPILNRGMQADKIICPDGSVGYRPAKQRGRRK